MSRHLRIAMAGLLLWSAGCSGDDDGVAAIDAASGGGADAARPDAAGGADAAARADAAVDDGTLIVVPSTFTLPIGWMLQLQAYLLFEDGGLVDVTGSATWASDAPSVVAVDADGLVTGIGPGIATISATVADVTATAAVTVTGPIVSKVAVTPSAVSVYIGCTAALTATATFSDFTTLDVTDMAEWTSANPALVTVSAGGVVQGAAPTGTPITITAEFGDVSGTAAVSVFAVPYQVVIAPAEATIPIGGTQPFTATRISTSGSMADVTHDPNLTWSSENPAVAPIDADGIATGVTLGETEIHAVLAPPECPGLAVEALPATLAVTDAPVDPGTLLLLPGSFVLHCEVPQQLTAILVRGGSSVDVTDEAVWSSTAPFIATVSAGGLVTATGPGAAVIEATLGGLTASSTAVVSCPLLAAIEVAPPNATLTAGCAPEQLGATARFSDGSTAEVTDLVEWTSSNPAVATVSSSGLVQGVAAGGPVTIAASLSFIEGGAQILVDELDIDSLTIAPESASIAVGESQSFTATVQRGFGSTEDVTDDPAVTWSSDDGEVGFVVDNEVYGVAPGTTQIHAVLEVCSSTFVAPPATVTVTGAASP